CTSFMIVVVSALDVW
nr:immunoglobulin heavy chain junction region [Macaca mulatta]MOV47693.1 immunoglobulin heavy chain junction region [Macaca mulatta]MOV47863.1 immunoglobulin heavy chain junction region [Macaca mulatta]MOV48231.1 immunoglobulin heavy chain junction region [Macaca mulatta]MOV48336.1 immunoglobulin heavy chain junction region [Macaca mulatta]